MLWFLHRGNYSTMSIPNMTNIRGVSRQLLWILTGYSAPGGRDNRKALESAISIVVLTAPIRRC